VGTPALELFINGELDLTGGGLLNPAASGGRPGDVVIWGTAPLATGTSGTQSIKIAGGPDAQAAIYAPNADVTIAGNAQFFGAITSYSVPFIFSARVESYTGLSGFHLFYQRP
jgi:hypothetical protein